jgi:UPF0755 protein
MLHRLLGISIILLSVAAAWLMMELRQFADTPLQVPEEGATYLLKPGSSFNAMATDLEQQGYISNAFYLRLMARWNKVGGKIKAGEYLIPTGTKPEQFLNLLVSGKVVNYSVTLIEGWTFREALAAIRQHTAVKAVTGELSDEEIMKQLGREGEHPEGRFLADTYHFNRGTTDLAILKRAADSMDRLLADEWEERAPELPYKEPYEALILASIVEKETGLASERPEIAGVFVRRLRKGMKLQTDPTVIYGMGERFDGNIRRRDLREDTPYNTYVHTGLTPTPISLPGREAVHAVLHPNDGKSLYFVAKGDGSGAHYFSATLKEHNRAVRKYQLKKR